jgi:hypothetical protein
MTTLAFFRPLTHITVEPDYNETVYTHLVYNDRYSVVQINLSLQM